MIIPFDFAPQPSIVDDYMPEGRKKQAFFSLRSLNNLISIITSGAAGWRHNSA
jgi:hypothetical protein